MKIAVIGSGISGLTVAHTLAPEHEVTLFEADGSPGGHTATIDVSHEGQNYAIDTGFIVFNDRTYPEFIRLLDELGVKSRPAPMSFSVSDSGSGIEYAGSSLDTLFAQRRNLVSPRFMAMVRDILRFNKQAPLHLARHSDCRDMNLGEYLLTFKYSQVFRDLYLIPMGAAIWSSGSEGMMALPLQFFVRFFQNHGLLNIRNRPQWRVIEGGSRNYIPALTARYKDRIELANPVRKVTRVKGPYGDAGIRVDSLRFKAEFDQVVFACHSDQALEILGDASNTEQEILSAIPYSRNEAVLHRDEKLLPANKRCWSSWNVSLAAKVFARPTLTYNMNILQGINSEHTFCVSLNQSGHVDPAKIHGVYQYDHPVFTEAGISAQQRWREINGVHNTWFCGAYWRNGFHEDGVWSALRVARQLQKSALENKTPKLAMAV
jgi:predicted NAD/FAD-binding protein